MPAPDLSTDLHALRNDLAVLISEGFHSTTTRRNMVVHTRRFERMCAERGEAAVPADPSTVVDFMVHLRDDLGLAPGTISRALDALREMHHRELLPDPTDDVAVRTVMAGLFRSGHDRRPAAPPMTRDLLRQLMHHRWQADQRTLAAQALLHARRATGRDLLDTPTFEAEALSDELGGRMAGDGTDIDETVAAVLGVDLAPDAHGSLQRWLPHATRPGLFDTSSGTSAYTDKVAARALTDRIVEAAARAGVSDDVVADPAKVHLVPAWQFTVWMAELSQYISHELCDRSLILTSLFAGVNVSQLVLLRWRDIDLDEALTVVRVPILHSPRGIRFRSVPLRPTADPTFDPISYLRMWAQRLEAQPDDLVWPSVGNGRDSEDIRRALPTSLAGVRERFYKRRNAAGLPPTIVLRSLITGFDKAAAHAGVGAMQIATARGLSTTTTLEPLVRRSTLFTRHPSKGIDL